MSTPKEVREGTVSGNQVSIPAHSRRPFDIEHGDAIELRAVDGELAIEVRSTETGVVADFEPGRSDEAVDVVTEHDRFGLE